MMLTPEERHAQTQKILQQVTRREIVLPFALGIVGIVVLVVIAALTPRPFVVADVLLTTLILCPAMICMIPIYILLVAAIWGMGRVTGLVAKPLAALEKLTARAETETKRVSATAMRQTATFSTQVAPLEHLLDHAFEPKSKDKADTP